MENDCHPFFSCKITCIFSHYLAVSRCSSQYQVNTVLTKGDIRRSFLHRLHWWNLQFYYDFLFSMDPLSVESRLCLPTGLESRAFIQESWAEIL